MQTPVQITFRHMTPSDVHDLSKSFSAAVADGTTRVAFRETEIEFRPFTPGGQSLHRRIAQMSGDDLGAHHGTPALIEVEQTLTEVIVRLAPVGVEDSRTCRTIARHFAFKLQEREFLCRIQRTQVLGEIQRVYDARWLA